MSENKNIPEIIYVPEKMLLDIESGTSLITNKISSLNEVEYILKSKYDEIERANRVSRNLAEMAKSNYDDLKVMYDLLLKEKEELEKKLSEVKKRTEIIKQDAEYKLQENSDRPLSESTIEADACIDVCNEILMTIIKPTEK